MEYLEAFITFLKAFFNALTAFLGRNIPIISDLDSIDLTGEGTTEPETEAEA